MINHKVVGPITKHIRYDFLLYYKFIIRFAGESIFKIGEQLAKLRTKWLIASCAPFACTFVLKYAELVT